MKTPHQLDLKYDLKGLLNKQYREIAALVTSQKQFANPIERDTAFQEMCDELRLTIDERVEEILGLA